MVRTAYLCGRTKISGDRRQWPLWSLIDHAGFANRSGFWLFCCDDMLDKNAFRTDLRSGNHVRIRRSWRLPLAGRSGVVTAIEPNDPYGPYLIEFDDGMQFRYERRDLELIVTPFTFPDRVVLTLLRLA